MLIREEVVESLLNRQILKPDTTLMSTFLSGKAVLVAGAGGTIGAALCNQIIQQQPATLVLYEFSEPALQAITGQLRQVLSAQKQVSRLKIVPVLASINDTPRLKAALQHHRIDIIFHAAAYKHVDLIEKNVFSGIQNNIFGTRVLGHVARTCGVGHVVFVSTDKAHQPNSIMGVTKRLAEQCLLSAGPEQTRTRFSIVRFGNVLDSSGSVIPLFQQQILGGGPVTVTHPEMTREFLTAIEAAQLTIQAGAISRGKEVFSFKISEPVRIVDLARKLIGLLGYSECKTCSDLGCHCEKGIRVRYIGLREGESEASLKTPSGQAKGVTRHPNIYTLASKQIDPAVFRAILVKLEEACERQDESAARHALDHAARNLNKRLSAPRMSELPSEKFVV